MAFKMALQQRVKDSGKTPFLIVCLQCYSLGPELFETTYLSFFLFGNMRLFMTDAYPWFSIFFSTPFHHPVKCMCVCVC